MSNIETNQSHETPREKLRRETTETLNWLRDKVNLNSDPGITKQPRLEKGVAVFNYKYMGWDWEIVTRKEGNGKYSVRIKKWVRFPDGKYDWQTQKNGDNKTFPIIANDKLAFNRKLGVALDAIIGKKRDRLPTTGGKVYDLLNPDKSTPKKEEKSESTEKRSSKFDTRYEKEYGVNLIRDKGLTFYVVKDGEGLIKIRNKLMRIPEFSYLSDKYYDIPSDGSRNIHSFNTPNVSLKKGFYLPIPLKREQREISVSSFKSKARKILNEMKNNKVYGEKIKGVLKNINEREVVNIMSAYARSETSEDYTKFSDPIGSVELHRWEKKYKAYSFSYFHILMEKTADRKHDGPGLRARKNLGLSEGDCYGVENACRLFLGYCFEKGKEFRLRDDFFFKINSKNAACDVADKYNGQRSYGEKLWANLQYCKKIS